MAEFSDSPSSMAESLGSLDHPNHITLALTFFINSIKNLTQNPLKPDNYTLRSNQILRIFRANGFKSFLDKSNPPPPKSLPNENGNLSPNPLHRTWTMTDQHLSAALLSTISQEILPYTNNLPTTADIWQSLHRRLQSSSRSRILQLRNELHHLSMQNKSMRQYLTDIKSIVDTLASAGAPISPEDVILYTLNGLPLSYQGFKTSIRTRLEPIPLDDFYALLGSEEINLAMEKQSTITNQLAAMQVSRGRASRTLRGRRGGFSGRGRSSPSDTSPSRIPRSSTIYQICGKIGHSAYTCWHRQNMEYTRPQTSSSKSTYHTDLSSWSIPSPSNEWLLDSGASANLTSHASNLQQLTPYEGSDQVTIGNGSSIPISHIGTGHIQTNIRKFHISNLLHVPHIHKNLLSVQQFTTDNDCTITFDSYGFVIKDQKTHRLLHQGRSHNGLYSLSPSTSSYHTSIKRSDL